MRYFCLILFVLSALHTNIYGQQKKSGEIGLSAGGSYYLGDINKIPFKGTRFSAGFFYRHTFDTRYALRTSLNYVSIFGDDANTSSGFQNERNAKFSQKIYDLNAVGEFHFIPFLPGKIKYHKYSPYVFAGLGLSYLPQGSSNFLLTIPFGLGIKFNFKKNLTIAFETSFHKTFKDNLENQLDKEFYIEPTPENSFKQYYYAGNKDWYSIFGIKLAYKIKYKMKCPAFD